VTMDGGVWDGVLMALTSYQTRFTGEMPLETLIYQSSCRLTPFSLTPFSLTPFSLTPFSPVQGWVHRQCDWGWGESYYWVCLWRKSYG
jgi:hypothetical protein